MFRETAGDEADEHMASLMGHFGQTTNSLSLLMSLFGTSLCVRLLGLRKTLRIFPSLLVVAVVTSFFAPSLSFLFVAVAILKVRAVCCCCCCVCWALILEVGWGKGRYVC